MIRHMVLLDLPQTYDREELAAVMAGISFCLSMMIPRHPMPGNETIFSGRLPQAAESLAWKKGGS